MLTYEAMNKVSSGDKHLSLLWYFDRYLEEQWMVITVTEYAAEVNRIAWSLLDVLIAWCIFSWLAFIFYFDLMVFEECYMRKVRREGIGKKVYVAHVTYHNPVQSPNPRPDSVIITVQSQRKILPSDQRNQPHAEFKKNNPFVNVRFWVNIGSRTVYASRRRRAPGPGSLYI